MIGGKDRVAVYHFAGSQYLRQIWSDALDCDADISETAKGDHLAFGRIVVAHQVRISPDSPVITLNR